jgi:hypothetical protein
MIMIRVGVRLDYEEEKESLPAASFICADGSLAMAVPAGVLFISSLSLLRSPTTSLKDDMSTSGPSVSIPALEGRVNNGKTRTGTRTKTMTKDIDRRPKPRPRRKQGHGQRPHDKKSRQRKKKASEQANLKAHGEGNEEEKESLPAASFVCADGSLAMAVPAGIRRIR